MSATSNIPLPPRASYVQNFDSKVTVSFVVVMKTEMISDLPMLYPGSRTDELRSRAPRRIKVITGQSPRSRTSQLIKKAKVNCRMTLWIHLRGRRRPEAQR